VSPKGAERERQHPGQVLADRGGESRPGAKETVSGKNQGEDSKENKGQTANPQANMRAALKRQRQSADGCGRCAVTMSMGKQEILRAVIKRKKSGGVLGRARDRQPITEKNSCKMRGCGNGGAMLPVSKNGKLQAR